MREAWVIAAHYLGRMSRKPFLVLFLLAIPFTLLLAEFAAFGRTDSAELIEPLAVEVVRADHSAAADAVIKCLTDYPGHPLRLEEVRDGDSRQRAGVDRIVFASNGGLPLNVALQGANSNSSDSVLGSSLLKACALRVSQVPLNPVRLVIERTPKNVTGGANSAGSFFTQFFPGLALFGALFLSQAMASLVWRDQERAVQRRLLAMSIKPAALVFGPFLFLTIGVAGALCVILAVSAFAANLRALASPAFWMLALGFGVCAAGLQLVIGLMAGSQRAAQAISASTSMLLSFFGGGFVPLSLYPPFLRAVAYALPNGAAQAGLIETLERTGSLREIGIRVATVWAWGAVAMFAAVALQTRRMRT